MWASVNSMVRVTNGAILIAGRFPVNSVQVSRNDGRSWKWYTIDGHPGGNGAMVEVQENVVLYVYGAGLGWAASLPCFAVDEKVAARRGLNNGALSAGGTLGSRGPAEARTGSSCKSRLTMFVVCRQQKFCGGPRSMEAGAARCEGGPSQAPCGRFELGVGAPAVSRVERFPMPIPISYCCQGAVNTLCGPL